MEPDLKIRVVFGALVILLSGVQFVTRWYASRLMRQQPRGVETAEARGDNVVFVFMPLWAISVMIYPFDFAWFDVSIGSPAWMRWLGITLMTLSLPPSVQIFQALGENFSPRLELFEDHQFVTKGPYRFVRHPMYAVFILCAVGSSLASANLFVVGASIGASLVLVTRIKREEKMLLKRFGDSYGEYMKKTGAIFPKWVSM